jgi:hypothetical protein
MRHKKINCTMRHVFTYSQDLDSNLTHTLNSLSINQYNLIENYGAVVFIKSKNYCEENFDPPEERKKKLIMNYIEYISKKFAINENLKNLIIHLDKILYE